MNKTERLPDIPCVRCGYCCKKSTCPLGMQFGSTPENCEFLGGSRPGSYFCQIVAGGTVHNARTMVAIGEGCCQPLNSDRKIAMENIKETEEIYGKLIVINNITGKTKKLTCDEYLKRYGWG